MTTSIFDVDDQNYYVHEEKLAARAREMRVMMRFNGEVLALDDRPTLRLRPEDERHVIRHIHEGAWTIGMHEEDLPGFVAEEPGR